MSEADVRVQGRCPECGSLEGQWRGYRERKDETLVHKRWCKACGRWYGRLLEGRKAVCIGGVLASEPLLEKLAFEAWLEQGQDDDIAQEAWAEVRK